MALATTALMVIVSFLDIHVNNMPLSLVECAAAIVCELRLYARWFYVLFNALHRKERYDGFIPLRFRRTLIRSNECDPSAVSAPLYQFFMYSNRRMITSNASVKRLHRWESK